MIREDSVLRTLVRAGRRNEALLPLQIKSGYGPKGRSVCVISASLTEAQTAEHRGCGTALPGSERSSDVGTCGQMWAED